MARAFLAAVESLVFSVCVASWHLSHRAHLFERHACVHFPQKTNDQFFCKALSSPVQPSLGWTLNHRTTQDWGDVTNFLAVKRKEWRMTDQLAGSLRVDVRIEIDTNVRATRSITVPSLPYLRQRLKPSPIACPLLELLCTRWL